MKGLKINAVKCSATTTYPVVSTVIPRPFPGGFSPLDLAGLGLALTAGLRIPRTTPLTGYSWYK